MKNNICMKEAADVYMLALKRNFHLVCWFVSLKEIRKIHLSLLARLVIIRFIFVHTYAVKVNQVNKYLIVTGMVVVGLFWKQHSY